MSKEVKEFFSTYSDFVTKVTSEPSLDLEALKNENETENSAQDTQSTESNPLEASDITNENLNKENE